MLERFEPFHFGLSNNGISPATVLI